MSLYTLAQRRGNVFGFWSNVFEPGATLKRCSTTFSVFFEILVSRIPPGLSLVASDDSTARPPKKKLRRTSSLVSAISHLAKEGMEPIDSYEKILFSFSLMLLLGLIFAFFFSYRNPFLFFVIDEHEVFTLRFSFIIFLFFFDCSWKFVGGENRSR